MFLRENKLARLREIGDEVQRVAANPAISVQKKAEFVDKCEREAREIEHELANHHKALSMRHYADNPSGQDAPPQWAATKSKGVDSGQRLSFKNLGPRLAAEITRQGMAAKMVSGADIGVKAPALPPTGAAVVDQEFVPSPVALGQPATALLDVLPAQAHPTQEYAYLRQTSRTNNAAVVAELGTKPTSTYGVTRVEQTLAVIAHLSEGVPRYWFLDNNMLEGFISNELDYGLRVAVENKVLADINGTSGTQAQAYSTSVVQTLRKSLTKLELNGLVASSIVVHPSDWEGIELTLTTTNAIEHMSLPYDPASRRLWGVPVVVSVSEAAGVAHVLGADAVIVDTDSQGVGVQWSEQSNATDFAQNLIRARCEGRYGTSVLRPLGVVVADLTP